MDIDVKMGEIQVSHHGDLLIASGVGSCLVITIYDLRNKIGAMAHAMLPNRSDNGKVQDTRYVDLAIDEMLEKMIAQGSKTEDLEAKLVGGANMFPSMKPDIGAANILNARQKLKAVGIKLGGESVGGSIGRSVEFAVASGVVTIKIKF